MKEAYRAIKGADALDDSHKAVKWTETQLELAHGAHCCLRRQEDTVRRISPVTVRYKSAAVK